MPPWRKDCLMPRLPIVSNQLNTALCLRNSLLPTFYMEDYSVLGLRVGDLGAARQVLEENGITLLKKQGYIELSVDNKEQIPHIIQMLESKEILCEIAVIVEHVYQG